MTEPILKNADVVKPDSLQRSTFNQRESGCICSHQGGNAQLFGNTKRPGNHLKQGLILFDPLDRRLLRDRSQSIDLKCYLVIPQFIHVFIEQQPRN